MRATWPAQMLPKLPEGTAKPTRSASDCVDLLGIVPGCLEVAGEVIDDLRQQPRPVDRVDGADAVAALEVQVGADRLDDILAIVEDALDREVVDVGVLQAEHLRLLERAHAPVRAEHEDADAPPAAHRVLGCAAGIARGRAQDVEPLAAPAELVLEQRPEQLHRHVLERQRRAVGQLLDQQPLGQPHERCDLGRAEDLFGVGGMRQPAQVRRRDVVDVQRQDLERQLGIRQAAPARERRGVDVRVVRRQVQPAVGRQPFEQDVAEGPRRRVAAGAQVSQRSSSLRMRTMLASTVGSACIRASAASMRPSTVSCVRMMRSVWRSPSALSLCSTASIEMP